MPVRIAGALRPAARSPLRRWSESLFGRLQLTTLIRQAFPKTGLQVQSLQRPPPFPLHFQWPWPRDSDAILTCGSDVVLSAQYAVAPALYLTVGVAFRALLPGAFFDLASPWTWLGFIGGPILLIIAAVGLVLLAAVILGGAATRAGWPVWPGKIR